ncbi:postreplication repair E3 ubiquitin-protein ligase RAD18-like [Teleopsis dalmanni]|uniref:postreplication repair E3 ubiquitin-protein ligase RAD18-like n=1 Tax=Teleopsis dalmanni TaxID=139649 RepID=UPI0018CE7EF0|nr:postreplication repair E3 ubiquitin-protein ligase RAD18-like [Teleopsis dalmanni]
MDHVEDCAICLDELINPVITDCLHTFCIKCCEGFLESVMNNSSETMDVSFKCPLCRNKIKELYTLPESMNNKEVIIHFDRASKGSKKLYPNNEKNVYVSFKNKM